MPIAMSLRMKKRDPERALRRGHRQHLVRAARGAGFAAGRLHAQRRVAGVLLRGVDGEVARPVAGGGVDHVDGAGRQRGSSRTRSRTSRWPGRSRRRRRRCPSATAAAAVPPRPPAPAVAPPGPALLPPRPAWAPPPCAAGRVAAGARRRCRRSRRCVAAPRARVPAVPAARAAAAAGDRVPPPVSARAGRAGACRALPPSRWCRRAGVCRPASGGARGPAAVRAWRAAPAAGRDAQRPAPARAGAADTRAGQIKLGQR